MRFLKKTLLTSLFFIQLAGIATAEQTVFENFSNEADQRWSYIADGVMGGISDGQAVFERLEDKDVVRLTGEVSTKNNGGFIQVRRLLPSGLPINTTGLELDVKGNGEPYYVFIRTAEMNRPWYYYKARFDTGSDWQTVAISLDNFERSHAHLKDKIKPSEIISIGIFAYGSDYQADITVNEIRLF